MAKDRYRKGGKHQVGHVDVQWEHRPRQRHEPEVRSRESSRCHLSAGADATRCGRIDEGEGATLADTRELGKTVPARALPLYWSRLAPIDLSIVVPALNEESRIDSLIERVRSYLTALSVSWELIIVDDGSSDRTAALVEVASLADTRIRLIRFEHRGKGAAIRHGMLAARGACRFMADADLAVSMDQLPHFLDPIRAGTADIVIGSREAAGAERRGESVSRHALGRVFNALVQIAVLPGVKDTQCGFKMLHADAAEAILPHLTIDGFAFDVELLFVARRTGFRICEVGVLWKGGVETRVKAGRGAAAFVDILRVRWNAWRGRYDGVDKQGSLGSFARSD